MPSAVIRASAVAALALLGLSGCATHCERDTDARRPAFAGPYDGLGRAQGGCDGAARPVTFAALQEYA